ncbi:MAG: SPOR domain-containing protein [Bacteroidales bacterium]
MHIARYINDLLLSHDCVIIPGLGGFVCSYRPAKIHPVQHQFYPPSKTILFNRELQNNDGLLANEIVRRENVAYEAALLEIGVFVKQILSALNDGTRVRMEQIGVFHLDEEGNIQFDQDYRVNHLKSAYGLTGLVSPPVIRSRQPVHQSAVPAFRDRKPRTTAPKGQRMARWSMVGIPSILLVGLIALNMNQVKQVFTSEMSLLPSFGTNQEQTIPVKPPRQHDETLLTIMPQQTAEEKTVDEIHESAAGISDPSQEKTLEYQPQPMEPETTPEPETIIEQEPVVVEKYHLIAGSFAEIENAEKLMDTYRNGGYMPEVIGQASNGYYRVSIAAFVSKVDALNELRKVRELYNPNVWLLRQ